MRTGFSGARATGSWTPYSRVALTASAPASFGALWEEMARTSYATYQSYLGLPGHPVEWTERYFLSDTPDQGEADRAVQALAALYGAMGKQGLPE